MATVRNNSVLRLSLVVVALLTVSATVCRSEIKSFALRGKNWRGLAPDQKAAYLFGAMDGLLFAEKPNRNLFESDTTYQRYIDALDTFFADNRNDYIPPVLGMIVVSMQFRGAPQADIDKEVEGLRRQFPEPEPKPEGKEAPDSVN